MCIYIYIHSFIPLISHVYPHRKTAKHQAANVLNLWSVRQGLSSSPILCNHSALEGASGSKQSYLAFNNRMFWDVSTIHIYIYIKTYQNLCFMNCIIIYSVLISLITYPPVSLQKINIDPGR